MIFVTQPQFLRFVGGFDRGEDAQRIAVLPRGRLQRLDVLGEARAAIPDARVQKAVADARIRPDALAHLLDVGTEHIGKVGQFVHERNARREHRVGRVLGQLRRAHVHHQQPFVIALERRIHGPQQRNRALVVRADHDAIRAHEVLHRGAFLQKFRIGRDGEWHARLCVRRAPRQWSARMRSAVPTGTVDLSTITLNSVILRCDVFGRRDDMTHVGRTILVGRRADGDELQHAVRDRGVEIGREPQAPRLHVARDHFRQSRFVDRNAATLQGRDLRRRRRRRTARHCRLRRSRRRSPAPRNRRRSS